MMAQAKNKNTSIKKTMDLDGISSKGESDLTKSKFLADLDLLFEAALLSGQYALALKAKDTLGKHLGIGGQNHLLQPQTSILKRFEEQWKSFGFVDDALPQNLIN